MGEGPVDTASASERTITYTLNDSDGATATARYILGIHEPTERISHTKTGIYYKTDYFQPNGTTYHVSYPGVPASNYSISDSRSSGWSLSGSLGVPVLEDFGIPLGVELGYQWSHETTDTMSSPAMKNEDGSDIILHPGQYVYIRVKHTYNRHHTTFWKYNSDGKERRYFTEPGGNPIEVPHEAIWDVWAGDELVWSSPRIEADGYPEPSDPQEQLAPHSNNYAQSRKYKNGKPLA